MKLLHEKKLGFWDILDFICLNVCGCLRLMVHMGVIPTLPHRKGHSKESLKQAYKVAARINFMIYATLFGLQTDAKALERLHNRLRNIYSFREGYSYGLKLRDYRLLKLLNEENPAAFQLYFVLTQWDTETKYPKWPDLPIEVRNRMSREMSSNFVVFD